MRKNVIAVIQARMKSNRLPDKAMLDLAGKPLLAHVIERVQAFENVDEVFVATSYCGSNKPIIDLAFEMRCNVFVGAIEDVLERFYIISEEYPSKYIARITGDNPFIDVNYGSFAIKREIEKKFDLLAMVGLPIGTGIEIFKSEAIQRTYNEVTKKSDREHVTTYIKNNRDKFNVEFYNAGLQSPLGYPRLTVDYEEDYVLAKMIYGELYKKKPFSIEEVVHFLESNPDLLEINKSKNT